MTPDGAPDPSVFSTEFNPEGIQVGTAITLLVRRAEHRGADAVQFRHVWGKAKRAQLVEGNVSAYQEEHPVLEVGLPYMPTQVNPAYLAWPKLPDLFPVSFPGVKTSRDDVVVDIDRDRLEARMRQYFDPTISHEAMRRIAPGAMEDSAGYKSVQTREQLQKLGFSKDKVVRYCYRPFDTRWLYWESSGDLLDRSRAEYFPHIFAGNTWIEARQKQPMERFDRGYVVSVMSDNFGNGLSNYFPLFLKQNANGPELFVAASAAPRPNVSDMAQAYLTRVEALPPDLFSHAIAVLHAPAYRAENGGALRQDWPRIPLPATGDVLRASAGLGRRVAALLDTEQAAEGLRDLPFTALGQIAHATGGQLRPDTTDVRVTVGWGHRGQEGATMPGRGRVTLRDYTPDELAALTRGAATLGLNAEAALACLGERTCDVWLNDIAYWANVPERVWDYTIGGYTVIKKWLSYREGSVLGRPLNETEVAQTVPAMVRRIAALLLLGPALDANYRAVAG